MLSLSQGHDFVILGHSQGLANPLDPSAHPVPFDPKTDMGKLDFTNPTRRDATILPSFGWLAVAFQTGNPGAWLFHCHVIWHAAQGLSVQFIEGMDVIGKTMDLGVLDGQCNDWRSYVTKDPFKKGDSGI
jgi:hypothetical protein